MNIRSFLFLIAAASASPPPPRATAATTIGGRWRHRRRSRPRSRCALKDASSLRPTSAFVLRFSDRAACRSLSSSYCRSLPSRHRRRCRHFFTEVVVASSSRGGADLDTSFEWLAEERARGGDGDGETTIKIEWFDPSLIPPSILVGNDSDGDSDEFLRMPLYPLGAVHVPHSGEDYTLINVEARNVKMARDLVAGKWKDSLFVASLRAKDTNRVASVGTIMKLVGVDDAGEDQNRRHPAVGDRVVTTCRAIGIAEVMDAWNEESLEEDSYLVAKVRVRPPSGGVSASAPGEDERGEAIVVVDDDGDDGTADSTVQRILNDYQTVRSLYVNSESLASNELPPFAARAIEDSMPVLDGSVESYRKNTGRIWMAIDAWQRLCNTVREAQRARLRATVNELSVEAAMQISGPLQLPVRRETLPTDVRLQLGEIEAAATREFYESGMDPVLDFQELISTACHQDRVEKLAKMLFRERQRLEAKERLMEVLLGEYVDEDDKYWRGGFE